MDLKTQFAIRNHPYIARYLRENSYWYKYLTRDPSSLQQLENEMKERYHLTAKDRIEDFSKKIELIRNFMDILN